HEKLGKLAADTTSGTGDQNGGHEGAPKQEWDTGRFHPRGSRPAASSEGPEGMKINSRVR
ncbi:MAG: hypothetical protein KDG54_10725, partial [Geminicoccaceae bacterium]|nr:hypothetical protein [Geminicoccaceae bacterium]